MKFASALTLPRVSNFVLGCLFISSGIEKLAMTDSINEAIRKTKFHTICVNTLKIPFDREGYLTLFTKSLGVVMVSSGTAYLFNVQRAVASTAMAFMLFCFTFFLHTNLDEPLKTQPKDLAVWGINSLFMTAYLYKGRWVRGGPRFAKILGSASGRTY